MGCNCSRDNSKIIVSNLKKNNNKFTLKIHIPNSDKCKTLIFYSLNNKETIINLFNYFFFLNEEEKIDVNFISIYNKKNDTFDYYIERLNGYEIENEENPKNGKLWNCYINKKKLDWSFACHNNRIIDVNDEIELIYEGDAQTSLGINEYEISEINN